MTRIAVVTNIAPHYRRALWKELIQDEENIFVFFYGESKSLGIRSIDFSEPEFLNKSWKFNRVKNLWFRNDILIWQKGIIKLSTKGNFNQMIFLGEMYCLSTWISAFVARLRGKTVTFWGHGFYGNEGRIKKTIRGWFNKIAHNHLVYERRSKELMVQYGFDEERIFVIFNSLNYDEHTKMRESLNNSVMPFPFFLNSSLPTLVFIGRLTSIKRLDILISAGTLLNLKETQVNLLFIGDGPQREFLEGIGQKGVTEGWIHFYGSLYDEKQIATLLYHSDLCVSPGNVGLTAIHSLSFGTPVCTHSNFANQMPEAGSISEGYNGIFFEQFSVADLARKIEWWLMNKPNRDLVRADCYAIIDSYYNPKYQKSVLDKLISSG